MAKILVIDDEQGIRTLLDMLLRRKGYDVLLADGGRRAWASFAVTAWMSLCLI